MSKASLNVARPSRARRCEDRGRSVRPAALPCGNGRLRSQTARPRSVTPINLWRRINPPLRPVLTGAAAVSALFIMGIALGVFHSRTPLANPANHASGGANAQSGGVTMQTGGVTVQTGPAKPQPGKPAAVRRHRPNRPRPMPAHQRKPRRKRRASLRRAFSRHSTWWRNNLKSTIGDDVVIRHFSRPVPTQKPKQAGQQAGLKHFSDLEN